VGREAQQFADGGRLWRQLLGPLQLVVGSGEAAIGVLSDCPGQMGEGRLTAGLGRGAGDLLAHPAWKFAGWHGGDRASLPAATVVTTSGGLATSVLVAFALISMAPIAGFATSAALVVFGCHLYSCGHMTERPPTRKRSGGLSQFYVRR